MRRGSIRITATTSPKTQLYLLDVTNNDFGAEEDEGIRRFGEALGKRSTPLTLKLTRSAGANDGLTAILDALENDNVKVKYLRTVGWQEWAARQEGEQRQDSGDAQLSHESSDDDEDEDDNDQDENGECNARQLR
ncbi:MAG: hypothetical protein AAF466_14495 [Bacteroidota bacterium]